MYQLVGYQKRHLKFKDGNEVDGFSLFLTESREGVEGFSTDSVFISTNRLDSCGYKPVLGDRLNIFFNRFGKIASVVKV